jgi:hypothetical protein
MRVAKSEKKNTTKDWQSQSKQLVDRSSSWRTDKNQNRRILFCDNNANAKPKKVKSRQLAPKQ